MFTTLLLVLSTLISTLAPEMETVWIDPAPAVRSVASVQLDLLPDPVSAETLADSLESALDDDVEVFVEVVPGDAELPPSYRVGLGPFESFEEAEQARDRAEQAGFDGFVRAADQFVGC